MAKSLTKTALKNSISLEFCSPSDPASVPLSRSHELSSNATNLEISLSPTKLTSYAEHDYFDCVEIENTANDLQLGEIASLRLKLLSLENLCDQVNKTLTILEK